MLLQNRVKLGRGGYIFAGGLVEKKKFFVQAAAHEMREEIGLTVYGFRFCGMERFTIAVNKRRAIPIQGRRAVVFLKNQFSFQMGSLSIQRPYSSFSNRSLL